MGFSRSWLATRGASRERLLDRLRPPGVWTPLWKRFTWRRLRELAETPPRPADLIDSVIEGARRDILIAEAFLRTGERGPRIYLERSRGEAPPPEG